MDVNGVFVKSKKKKEFRVGGGVFGLGQGGCERRSEVFVKIQKQLGGGGRVEGGGSGRGGEGRGRVWVVRVDENEELKFL